MRGLAGGTSDTGALVLSLTKARSSGLGSCLPHPPQLVFGMQGDVFIPTPQAAVCLASGGSQSLAGIGGGG